MNMKLDILFIEELNKKFGTNTTFLEFRKFYSEVREKREEEKKEKLKNLIIKYLNSDNFKKRITTLFNRLNLLNTNDWNYSKKEPNIIKSKKINKEISIEYIKNNLENLYNHNILNYYKIPKYTFC